MKFDAACRILPFIGKQELWNLVDSAEQDHYSRRAYFCMKNYIGTRWLNISLCWLIGSTIGILHNIQMVAY